MQGFRYGKRNYRKGIGYIIKSLALVVFTLMLASQAVSIGGPGTVLGSMVPIFAFGGNTLVVHHATAAQQSTGQTNSSLLQPGKVNYLNTWNNSLALSCTLSKEVSQPLSTSQDSWSTSVEIPTQLFMFKTSGSFIQQNYTVNSNGTMSVDDGFGNHFALNILGVHAQNGTLSTTFLSNASYAILNYLVSSGGKQQSNVSIVFASTNQFCKPSGIEITITGNENWGPSNSGTIAFAFNTIPTSVINNTAWFDTAKSNVQQNSSSPVSPVSLGFDWNGSSNLNPVYNNVTNSLSYLVGTNFTIDPTVIGTSTTSHATNDDYSDHVCQANGLYWFYYGDASNAPVYRTSSNGSTWSSTQNFTSQIATNFAGPFSMYCSGTSVYYEGSIDSSSQSKFWWGDGTMQSNGTVTWTYQKSVTTGNSGVQQGSITVDSSGNLWVSEFEVVPSNKIEVFKSSNLTANTWANKLNITGMTGSYATQIVPLTSGKVALLYGGAASTQTAISIREFSGSSWSSAVSTSRTTLYMDRSSAVALGDTVELAVTGGVDVYYYPFTYGSGSWPSSVAIATSTVSKTYAGISSDANKELVMSYLINSSVLQYVASSNSGGSWSEPVTVFSTSNNQQFLSPSLSIISNDFLMGWISGSSSPYNIEFMSEPAIIPTAASNPLPWSQPGLSPYESYFSQLDESVSPGNGLLGVIQTDLSMPGRDGLSLNISNVYSSPYAFLSTANTPFEYDNYTLSNIGLGWSLNFPWLGNYYLHLLNGEVFAYNWTGNVFINHKTVNFALYSNSNGTYTCMMPPVQLTNLIRKNS